MKLCLQSSFVQKIRGRWAATLEELMAWRVGVITTLKDMALGYSALGDGVTCSSQARRLIENNQDDEFLVDKT